MLTKRARHIGTRSIKIETANDRTKYILEVYTDGGVVLMTAWMLVLVVLEAQCRNQKGKMAIKEGRVNSKIFWRIKQREERWLLCVYINLQVCICVCLNEGHCMLW